MNALLPIRSRALAASTGGTYNGLVLRPSSGDLAPGVAFGSYVVRELIGRGGMATVYRAEHLLLRKPVALKVMDRALLMSSGAHQRFVLEGRTVAAIKHPNVVDIADVGVYDGVPYLVMELLEGEDLEGYLRHRPPLDDGAAIRLALPIIAALHAAHGSGVVHRDIKPSNIFMSIGPDDQRVPKVLDFGISKVSFQGRSLDLAATPQHHIMGTPRYLPPEALHGATEVGPLSDQYSLAVVLYQCVTGCTPFAGDTLLALLESLSRGAFQSPRSVRPSISRGLDRVITRAMSPDASDRFPTMRDMGCALLELAGERTQMVWGPAFRSSGAGAPSWRGGAPPSRERPPATEPIPPARVAVFRRWRPLLIVSALMLSGALVAALWSALSGPESRRAATPPASAAPAQPMPSPERPPAVATPAASPDGDARSVTAVVGLMPARADHPPAPPAASVSRARPQRQQERRTDGATPGAPGDDAPGTARSAAEGANDRATKPTAPLARAAPEASPAPPTGLPLAEPVATPSAATAPNEPASTAPRHGANRSPLLD